MQNIEIQIRKYLKYQMYEKEFIDVEYNYDFIPSDGNLVKIKKDWNDRQALVYDGGAVIASKVTLLTQMQYGKTYTVSFNINIDNSDDILVQYYHNGSWHGTSTPGFYQYTDDISSIYFTFSNDKVSITDLTIVEESQENYSVLDIDQNTKINISKSLKDIRTPGSNGTNWSKEFLVPITPTNSEFFDYYESTDIALISSIYYYESYIVYDGINNIKGRIYLDSMITNNDGSKYYKLLFVGENANLFNAFKENYLYLLDTATYANLDYATITTGNYQGDYMYSAYLSGNTGDTMLCYGLFDRGEDLSDVFLKQPITQATNAAYVISGITNGILSDSFTPAFFNWWLFIKIHEDIGYSVGGDIFEDLNFLNLTTPITRKNFWLDNDYSDVDENIIEDWYPNINKSINLFYSGTYLLDSTIGSTTPNDRFNNTSGSYIYYSPFDLSIVRQQLQFDYDYDIITTLGSGNYYTMKAYIDIYANQQYGVSGSTASAPILIKSIELPTLREPGSGVGPSSASVTGTFTTDYLAFYYLANEIYRTYFSANLRVTGAYVTDGSTDIDFNMDFTVNTLVDSGDTKLRINNYPGAQIGTFSYPQDITYFDFVKDQINMFNLTVDIDENTKTVYYNKWKNFLDSEIQDLSQNIILDKTIEKSFTNTLTPFQYKYSFGLDDTDYFTNQSGINDSEKDITFPVNKLNENIINTEIKGNFLYDIDIIPISSTTTATGQTVLYNGLGAEAQLTGDSAINYDYSKLYYAYFVYKDTDSVSYNLYSIDLVNGVATGYLPVFTNCAKFDFSYNYGNIILSFEDIVEKTTSVINVGLPNLYDEYYKDIIELINAPNSYVLIAYFMLDSITFYNLDLKRKVRIGNSLFLINKITDWNPNTPTKIELIKITNSNI